MPRLYLVVIAGGSGTRFWPKSTSKKPKQLLAFGTESSPHSHSLLAQTLSRFDHWIPVSQRMIVTTRVLEAAVQAEAGGARVMAEPQGRNTAPCVYWAARAIAQEDPQGIMLIMPSDHYIAQPDRFIETVKMAAEWASETDDLVTLGIQPTRPETGYGYLKTSTHPSTQSSQVQKVDAFVEKPNLEKATSFLQAGNYLWNGGMFIWKVSTILNAFDRYMPEMKQIWDSSSGNVEQAYPKMPATSIDYGIMEKASNVVSFPLNCGWDDLGSWTSLDNLASELHAQKDGNVVTAGDLLAIDSINNIVDAPKRFVSLLGVKDLIIVEQGDAILVAHKSQAQEIRRIVDEAKKRRPDLT